MKLFWVIMIVMIATPGIAHAAYMNDTAFDQGNGIYLTFMNTTFDNLTCCSLNTFFMNVSSHAITFTAGANKTVTNPTWDNDNFTFQVSGTLGYINFSSTMMNTSNRYDLIANEVFVESSISDITGIVWFNYTGDGIYTIYLNESAPVISIINNSKTKDAAITKIFLNNTESITFYVSSNHPVTTWSWVLDNVLQSNHYDYFTPLWSKGKYHYVSVNASNTYGSSNTLTWGVNVYPAMATATIGALNETPADEIREALENKDAPALVMATVLPFTNLIGAFFYAIVWFIVFVMMWIKQKSMNIPMVIGIIFGGLIISFLPEQYQLVATALIVFGIFAVIYIFFKGRG